MSSESDPEVIEEELSSEEYSEENYNEQNYVTITDKMYIDNQNLWIDILKEKNNSLTIEKHNIEMSLKLKHSSEIEKKYMSILKKTEIFRIQRSILLFVNIMLSKDYWLPFLQILFSMTFTQLQL